MTPLNAILDTLTALSYALTDKVPRISAHNLEQVIDGQEFYLPDGGYSRIVVSIVTGKAFLTSNSRDNVKKAWSRCHELVSDLERRVAVVRREQGWKPA